MTMQTVSNLYCPGCTPGDFAHPHICGVGSASLTTGRCFICSQYWTGSHICMGSWQGAGTVTSAAPVRDPSVLDLMGRAMDMILAKRLTRAAFRELFFGETPEEADATLGRIDSEQSGA